MHVLFFIREKDILPEGDRYSASITSGLREQDLVGIKLELLRRIMKNVEGWSQPCRGILAAFKIASK